MRSFKDGETITIEPFRARHFRWSRIWWSIAARSTASCRPADSFPRDRSAPEANAIPVPKHDADLAMDAAACIGCGACVAACPNASAMLFMAAKVSHLRLAAAGASGTDGSRAQHGAGRWTPKDSAIAPTLTACEAVCPAEISVSFIAKAESRIRPWRRCGKRSASKSRSARIVDAVSRRRAAGVTTASHGTDPPSVSRRTSARGPAPRPDSATFAPLRAARSRTIVELRAGHHRRTDFWLPEQPHFQMREKNIFLENGRARDRSQTSTRRTPAVRSETAQFSIPASARMPRASETPKAGFKRRSGNDTESATGVTNSPRPRHVAAERKMKNGTSDPIDAASWQLAWPRFASQVHSRPSNVVAASLLPPPSPAPCGIFFSSSIANRFSDRSPPGTIALRAARLSSPTGREGSSQTNSIFPAVPAIQIVNRSQSEIGAIKVRSRETIGTGDAKSKGKIDLRGCTKLHRLECSRKVQDERKRRGQKRARSLDRSA